MEALLRKYLWAIDLAVTALCAIFLGRALSSAVEAKIVVPPVRPAARVPKAQTTTIYSKQIDDIMRRNLFCSTCPPWDPTPETTVAPDPNLAPQKTSLPLAVMAILYSPPPMGIKWSVAVIKDTEDKSVAPLAVGSKVRGAVVTEIGETRLYLDNNGRTEWIDLLDGVPQTATPTATVSSGLGTPPPAPSSASDAFAQEMDRGIRRVSEHQYEIQRSTLESVLGNMNLLSRSARIVPDVRDGRAAGFRLYSVRPDGPFAKIGMQNGDVISAINGLEITSPEKALEVYAKLKSASHLSVGLERNGQKVTKDYSIR